MLRLHEQLRLAERTQGDQRQLLAEKDNVIQVISHSMHQVTVDISPFDMEVIARRGGGAEAGAGHSQPAAG